MESFWKRLQVKQNNGKLADIPEISVNRFARDNDRHAEILDAKVFILTHCDFDIMANIFESTFLQSLDNAPKDDTRCLYMHQLSYNFLLYWTTTIFVEREMQDESRTLLQQLLASKRIVLLEKNTPTQIVTSNSYTVNVTALSAGHHAGSIMLLLEKSGLEDGSTISCRILYTGCCRVNLRDLRLMTPLHDAITGKPKMIHKLYLDTSFCTENITELPARRFVTEQLLDLTQGKIASDPDIRFELNDELVPARSPLATCSHFLRCVFEASMEPIHVSDGLAAFLRSIPNFPNLATTVANPIVNEEGKTESAEKSVTHYHCCCSQTNDSPLCSEEDEDWALRFEVNEISLQSNFSSRGSAEALKVFTDERNWKEHGYNKTVYQQGPTSIRAIYCHNLSRYEQARLMNYLNVTSSQVYPIYSAFGTTVKTMRTLLQQACDIVIEGEEPLEIVEDYPSYFYDCTGAPNYKNSVTQ